MVRPPVSQIEFENRDYSEFAQEFLRRNPVYREQFARARPGVFGKTQSFAARRTARSWGLEFPFRPRPARRSLSRSLASGGEPDGGRPRARPLQ